MKHHKYTTAFIFFGMTATLGIHQAAHADDDWVIEVNKQGITNPHQIAFIPFTGNTAISPLVLDQLAQTDLKASDAKLPSKATSVDAVLANIHAWRNTGYRYVVLGDSRSILGNKVATNFQIIDLNTARQLGANHTHISGASQAELNTAASDISSKIYQAITGKASDLVGRIAYVEETGDLRQKTSHLKIIDVASKTTRTIDTVQGAILTPTFSPDGSQLAYTVLENDALPVIYLYQLDSQVKSLATPFKGHNLSPSFSPDGSALLFSGSHDNHNPNIYRLDLNANRLTAITTLAGAENSPSYLSGNQIIFTADNGTRTQSIYRMALGSSPTRITTGSSPRVSRDGSQLAYTQGSNLIVSNVNGSNPKTIASIGTEGTASFSPSGQSVVYASHGKNSQLVIKNLASGQTTILPTTGIVKDPAWSAQ